MNTENNILLADFLGFQKTDLGWFDNEGVLSEIEQDNCFDSLYFDTDWNWLMAVVQKIEIECKYDVNIYGHYNWLNPFRCKIVDNRNTEIVYQANDSKIQCVYDACVEFVKWFKEQNNEK